MPSFEKPTRHSAAWFKIGILVVWLVSLALRFWGLERFNTLVFDEVYYVKFAHHYLSQTPFFDGHPPLSKYLIALGIWLGERMPFGHSAVNGLSGGIYSPWSYRWLNALTGSLIPLVVTEIAYQLTRRYSYAFIAGLFMALDGLFLVESRYALNNVYLIIFGLLGIWCLLLALNSPRSLQRELWLVLSGVLFGASASVKWNGLWFLLGAYGMWVSVWIIQWVQGLQSAQLDSAPEPEPEVTAPGKSPLERLTTLKPWHMLLYLAVLPAVFYRLSWIPHLQVNPKDTFWGLQQQILSYHQRVGNGPNVHPYCSDWFTWLWMLRPVAYFYQVTNPGDPLPTGKSELTAVPGSIIYDVHAIGNPFLWWLSTVAIAVVAIVLIASALNWFKARHVTIPASAQSHPEPVLALSSTELWLGIFLVVNYAAQLMPWVPVTRCVFLYHYMGASVFATMAIAWLVDRWVGSSQARLRMMGIGIMLLIGLGFLFWMPIYLGLPLSPAGFELRMWLSSWR
ncbi:phospholipid carrier-dependent glycosyltransferase [Leptothermofonsia sichuanensis E412]|uniref:dolichyl-phosphate-mannose--protein mannosyltransferase n=1 Tax=Leptothermofonsia sichuanensis TaxID=2917832 RepID=UPI001CA7B49D|nr:phospholipid carrier-dependent glycosyltransferase [Leptothermofonsia sichuanensis]QZZ22335.1 phospholipid carrier-dependent glycosyltransferase [Leptothermofonsia sichuanensis E412]